MLLCFRITGFAARTSVRRRSSRKVSHATTSSGSKSPSTITAWWSILIYSCRPPSPGVWVCGNSLTITLRSAAGYHRRLGMRNADALRTGGGSAPWAARSRRRPPCAPCCAASGGATAAGPLVASWFIWLPGRDGRVNKSRVGPLGRSGCS